MSEDAVDMAIKTGGLPFRECRTRHLKIHGFMNTPDRKDWLHIYGSDREEIVKLRDEAAGNEQKLHQGFDFTVAEVIWAVRREMARTVDDVLARRVRALYLDARASVEMATVVASIMATELGKDQRWEEQQVADYKLIAKGYILDL
jgi:glycerol-3-phosphate dehydrogenase